MRLIVGCRIVLAFSLCICGAPLASAQSVAKAVLTNDQQSCLKGAQAALGPGAVVLRCGDLNGSGKLEVVAAMVLRPSRKQCTAVSRIVILGGANSSWTQVFLAGTHFEIKNTDGYVGIDYIDDADQYRGFCVEITDRNRSEPFSIALAFISSGGRVDEDGLPIRVAWNSKVGRYQEIESNEGPPQFASESKSPPHRNSKMDCCSRPTSPPKKQ
jgi:hypothetical protein